MMTTILLILKGRMKTILLPPIVMLLPREEREGTLGDIKEEGMISKFISPSLKDSLILTCSYIGSKLWREYLNTSKSLMKRKLS